jgi:hypothetical protein
MKSNDEIFADLRQHIKEYCNGDLDALAKHLDDILYMLFFVDEDVFSLEDLQYEAVTLKSLKDVFAGKAKMLNNA